MKIDYGSSSILVTKPMRLNTVGHINALRCDLLRLQVIIIGLSGRLVNQARLSQSHARQLGS